MTLKDIVVLSEKLPDMIKTNDFSMLWRDEGQQILTKIDKEMGSGLFILGNNVKKFETRLAKYWNKTWAVGCGNGMDAIELGLRALKLPKDEAVVTTPLTAFATSLAIYRAGGVPIFVDVDDTGNMNLDQLEGVVRQKKVKFVVPVHLYGIPINLKRLEYLKKQYGLLIVEDCAQAIGSSYDGIGVGSVGDMAAVSFYPTKNLGAIGDGGAVLGNKKRLQKLVMAMRNYGQTSKYQHDLLGMNSRLDEIQAVILLHLLSRLRSYLKRRTQIADYYLKNIRNPRIGLPKIDPLARPVWHLFPILIEGSRNKFLNYLEVCGVTGGVHYPILVPEQKAFLYMPRQKIKFPLTKARKWARHEVSLPIHPFLSDAEIERVVKVCNKYT